MKKVLAIFATFVMAFAFSATVFAAGHPENLDMDDFHMNVRFWNTDNGTQGENRWSLHVVEFSADQQVGDFGGSLKYRIQDEIGTGGLSNTAQSYPVHALVYYNTGPHKFSLGLQAVPFGIYKWNNLYHPLLDMPGRMGQIWDHDWGLLYTYNQKPVLLNVGYFDNSGEAYSVGEGSEKNTITLRLGYDILANWNLGLSYLDGDTTNGTTKYRKWAIDTTWGIVPNLALNAQYVDYRDHGSYANTVNGIGALGTDDGKYGAIQLKWDIVKVPAPIDGLSFVLQASGDNPKATGASTVKQYQEEIILKMAKNLAFFWQNVQEKVSDAQIGRAHV